VNGYLQVVTAATELPITLATAREHLRIVGNDEDTALTTYLENVRDALGREVAGHITLLTTVYDWKLPHFHERKLRLPYPPLQSLVSISYFDTAGDSQTLTVTTDYRTHAPTNAPGYVVPAPNESWPSVEADRDDAVTIRFTAGYTQSTLPKTIRAAAMLALGGFWEFRESMLSGTIIAELPLGVRHLMQGMDYGFYG
jgi:uncharacterized phiE125 gp8 family phage protein